MGEVLLTLPSAAGHHRALVIKISNRVYRVEVEKLIEAFDAGGVGPGEFWFPLNDWLSLTDSLERAAELAAESLRNGTTCD